MYQQESLSKLKCLLNDVIPYLTAKKPKVVVSKMYTAHRIVCEPPPVGLVMRETTAEEDKTFSSCPLSKEDIEDLHVELYKQVYIHKQIMHSCQPSRNLTFCHGCVPDCFNQ